MAKLLTYLKMFLNKVKRPPHVYIYPRINSAEKHYNNEVDNITDFIQAG